MEKQIVTILDVRGYCENDTAFVNVEDIARKLGFVQEKKDRVPTCGDKPYTAIRWERVNGYLREFAAFLTENSEEPIDTKFTAVKAGDYIPEQIAYLLAMKASNEVAKAFQWKLANVILPEIRKTGSYSVNNVAQRGNVAHTQMQILCTAADDIKALADKMQQTFAVKQGMALAKATTVTEKIYQMDLTVFKELLAPVEDAGTLTATEIAKLVGMKSGQAVNKALCAQELAERTASGLQLTEKGKQYGEQIPYAAPNGHCGYQIKWNRNVIPLLQ